MKHLHLFIVAALILVGCQNNTKQVTSASATLIAVSQAADSIQDTDYINILAPRKDSLNKMLDVVIGYAPQDLSVHSPECTMLNFASDALFDMAKKSYDGQIDFAVVNIGGMRCNWEAGNITRRHIFELMPFDNRLVILTLYGSDIMELCQVFAFQGGQGVSRQLRMQIQNKQAVNVSLHGQPIMPDAVYYVATSDYLSGGADHFTPLTKAIDKYDTHLKIRDLYMQYVEDTDTIVATIDGRMTLID